MHPFKRILCPVDFSDFSRRAIKLARGLASDFGAELVLLHVMDIRAFSPAEAALAPQIDAANRRRVREQMEALARDEGVSPDQVEIEEGLPHKAIVTKARNMPADLVVMGTHGISGFERLLLGSVTEKVLHQVHVPLLAVSKSVAETSLAEGEQRFRTIVVATDLAADATDTIEYSMALADKYSAKVLILHVVPPPTTFFGPMEAPWMGTLDVDELSERLTKDSLKRMAELVPDRLKRDGSPELVVQEGTPSAAILDLAREREADLIVVGAHGFGRTDLGWVGSTCHRVMRAARCPVLAVRLRA